MEHRPLMRSDVELIAGISRDPFVDVFYPQSALLFSIFQNSWNKKISISDKFTKVVWKICMIYFYTLISFHILFFKSGSYALTSFQSSIVIGTRSFAIMEMKLVYLLALIPVGTPALENSIFLFSRGTARIPSHVVLDRLPDISINIKNKNKQQAHRDAGIDSK
jgi:hypothetical protein